MDKLIELKPCPFCGSAAVIEDSGPIDKYRSGYQVRCPAINCPVDNPVAFGDTENEAIVAWNTRAAVRAHDEGSDAGLRKPTDIGNLRGYLFAPFDCKWNGIVRDVTAEHEHDGECDAYAVFKNLVQIVRDNGQLDHSFPARMRLEEMFDVSPYGDEEVYVAWLRWAGDENHRHLVVCDSDDERAFKVYRRPTSPDSRACRPSTRQ
jgi:Lar family restriction alleviation protein